MSTATTILTASSMLPDDRVSAEEEGEKGKGFVDSLRELDEQWPRRRRSQLVVAMGGSD